MNSSGSRHSMESRSARWRAGRGRRLPAVALIVCGCAVALAGCVSPGATTGSTEGYTISRQRPNEVLTGRPIRNLIAGANLNRGEVAGVLAANPGLAEALERNGFRLDRITALRVSPTKVVDVYTKGE